MNQESFSLTKLPWRIKDGLVIFLLAWIGLPLLVFAALVQLSPLLPTAMGLVERFEAGDTMATFALTAVNSVASLAIIALYLRKYGVGLSALGLRRFSPGKAVLMVLGIYFAFGLLVIGLFSLVDLLFPGFNPDEPQTNDFTSPENATALKLSFIALVVFPPIVEEIVFRGILFPAFSRRFGYVFGAVISSILFGLAHGQLNVGIYTLVLGLLLCWMYVRLKSIIPGILFHALNNYLAFTTILKQ